MWRSDMKKWLLLLSLLVLACMVLIIRAFEHASPILLEQRTVHISGSARTYEYHMYVPQKTQAPLPVILFLHGAGERGNSGIAHTRVGLGAAVAAANGTFPAIVVFPHCPQDLWWTDSTMEQVAITALMNALQEFNGDPERIYLTGISMGGYGAWSLAVQYRGLFAALMPICGGIETPSSHIGVPSVRTEGDPYEYVAKCVGKTPTWIFHGERDPVIPVEESRKMEKALRDISGNVQYSEFAREGHQVWDRVYGDKRVFEWLFAQHRVAQEKDEKENSCRENHH